MGRLILERRGGRLVHVLDGRVVEQDCEVELRIRGGWLKGVYQWSGMEARWPGLRVPLDEDPSTARAAVLAVHPEAELRWPQSPAGQPQSPTPQSPTGQRKIA